MSTTVVISLAVLGTRRRRCESRVRYSVCILLIKMLLLLTLGDLYPSQFASGGATVMVTNWQKACPSSAGGTEDASHTAAVFGNGRSAAILSFRLTTF